MHACRFYLGEELRLRFEITGIAVANCGNGEVGSSYVDRGK